MTLRATARALATALLVAGCATQNESDDAMSGDDGAESACASVQDVESVASASEPLTGSPSDASVLLGTGSVLGGTSLVVPGPFGFGKYETTVGGTPCATVDLSAERLTCITGNHGPFDGDVPVVVTALGSKQQRIAGTFRYVCPWTYGDSGATSCGAAPPAHVFATQRPSKVFSAFDRVSELSLSGAGGSLSEDLDTAMLSFRSTVLSTAGKGLETAATWHSAWPLDFTAQTPKVWLRVDGVAHAKAVELRLASSPNNYFRFPIVASQVQNWATEGDWVSPSLPFSGAVVGNPKRDAITDVSFVATDNGTDPITVHMNGIGVISEPSTVYPKGVLTFSFDDGYEAQATVAAPILRRAGFAGTAYLIQGLVGVRGSRKYLSLAEAHALQDEGWDISVHAFATSVHTAGFPATPRAALESDIVSSRAWLMANGFRGYDHCAYPHGEFTGATEVLDLARKYFTSCRTIFSTSRESPLPSDPAKLRVSLVSAFAPAALVKSRIDEAIASHEWIILVFHNFSPVRPEKDATNDYSAVSFEQIVDYAKSSGIAVKTVSEVLAMD